MQEINSLDVKKDDVIGCKNALCIVFRGHPETGAFFRNPLRDKAMFTHLEVMDKEVIRINKLLVTSASLLVTSALLVVTRS